MAEQQLQMAIRDGTLAGIINLRDLSDEQLDDFNIRLTEMITAEEDEESDQEEILENPEDPQQMAEAEEKSKQARIRLDNTLEINDEVCAEQTRRGFERDDNRAIDRMIADDNLADRQTADILNTLRGDEVNPMVEAADILDSMSRRDEEGPPSKKSKGGGRYGNFPDFLIFR